MPEVLRTKVGVVTFLALPEPLTGAAAAGAFRKAFSSCLGAREVRLAVDLANSPTVDSAGLEALLDAHEELARMGGWVRLANPSPILREVLHITGVGQHVRPLDSAPPEATAEPAPRERRKLGELLLDKGLIQEERVAEAVRLQAQLGRRMGQIVVERGWVKEHDLLEVLSEQLELPLVRLRAGLYDPAVAAVLPRETAQRLKVLPLFRVRGTLTLATSDPQDIPTFEEVEDVTGCKVQPVLCLKEEITRQIAEVSTARTPSLELAEDVSPDFQFVETTVPDSAAIDELAAGSPVINFVNGLIQRAVREGASDIHIEPARQKCRVRFRIDGVLYEAMTPPLEMHPAIVSRLKVMANLDIAERRLPQDGRVQVQTQGRNVDLRFSSLPGIFGEKVVMRVLDKDRSILDLDRLGMTPENTAAYKRLLTRSFGLILVTGPTGSGKTTTLYAAINHLNSPEKNIVTIEDPVEYQIDVVNQNQVREGIGLTFAKILKHTLRQDPDVIMVGEIRERETADIAVQAALTGHLVLSTLHTNDSIGAVTRLLDMGIEPYLLTSAVIGVIGQRLVRKVCHECKTTYAAPPQLAEQHGWSASESVRLARGRGCPACYDSGYKGRIGIHEVLEVDQAVQRIVLSEPTREALAEHVRQRGFRGLWEDGLDRVRRGLSTVEEVSRAVNAS
ncbi:MAG: Flp pilus assembly complex ATPase component TadA [Deltaproteobacteria bacterium]|nr:Flp pilus assembly complex ATPase component TadA [Deltaproteobacteria bacterium]